MQPALKKSLTLFELIIAKSLLSVLVLAFSSMELFSRRHVVTSDRQALLQNEASLALEHMSKNVQQGMGNLARPALARHATAGIDDGFSVFIEPTPATPTIPGDGLQVDYILSVNTLSCSVGGVNETFSTHIRPGVVYGTLPVPLPTGPAGFYINITENSSMVEISLVARFMPNINVSLDNPQVVLKSRLYTRSSAAR